MADHNITRPKLVAERYRVSYDFTKVMESADTVSTRTITAKKMSDGTDATADVLEGPGGTGKSCTVTVKAGTVGQDYEISFRVTTTAGDVFVRTVLFFVR